MMASKPGQGVSPGTKARPWACPQPRSCLRVALVVLGVKVARARCRRWHGTREPVVSIPTASRNGRCRPPGHEREDRNRLKPGVAEYRCEAQGRTGPY